MQVIEKFIDTEIEPDMIVENVEVIYSDSARLQMKMITPLLKSFDSAREKRDEYPKGLQVSLYEKNGELSAEIKANWAKYDKNEELWEAQYNVVLINAEGQKLETEQIFWDTKKAVIYTDKYTKMTDTKTGNISSGESFWATQDFNEYKLFNRTGVGRTTIYMKDEED